MIRTILCLAIASILTSSAIAQTGGSWKRSDESVESSPITVFHSPQSINIPTAETIGKGMFEFEISHRFLPPISGGNDDLFGLDGPASIRFALGYGISDRLTATLGRSNRNDNIDLQVKHRVFETEDLPVPVMVAYQLGLGWTTDHPDLESTDNRAFQFYGRLIVNARLGDRFAVGVVPSHVHNSDFFAEMTEYTTTLGLHVQAHLTKSFSLVAEWDPAIEGYRNYNDPLSFGFELETGGHFFRVFATNSTAVNSSQYLTGAVDPAGWNYMRLGFGITRLLTL